MNAIKTARCPQCRQISSLETGNRFRPFCSERCKLLDLGEWFAEKHSIPVADSDSEIEGAVPRAQDPDRLQ
ncbi:MAG: DNA gyrase inhibitor YacG [Panacagrimonas sp.]